MNIIKINALKVLILVLVFLLNKKAYSADCLLNVRIESNQNYSMAKLYRGSNLTLKTHALLEALLAKVSCKLQPIMLTNNDAMNMLKDGTLAIMVGLSKIKEREVFSYFIGPYHTERIVAVGSINMKNNYQNLEQILALKGLISVTQGAYYGSRWQKALETDPTLSQRLIYLGENQQKFSMLMLDRVQISLEDEQIVDELLHKSDYKNRFSKLFTLHENPVYFAFSKKFISKELYQSLEQEWDKMLLSGEVDTIEQQFND